MVIQALGVSEGLAEGAAFVMRQPDLQVRREEISDIAAELTRLNAAIQTAGAQIAAQIEQAGAGEQAEILEAHQMMLEDADYIDGIRRIIEEEHVCAEYACEENSAHFQQMLRRMDDSYMQARAADVQDISMRLLRALRGVPDTPLDAIREPCILVAEELTPSDTARLGALPVRGFVTLSGGPTGHSAILARSMGLPAAVGAGEQARRIQTGDRLLLDGGSGELVVNPDRAQETAFARRREMLAAQRRMLETYRSRRGATADGRRVGIEGNIGVPEDAVRVKEAGGEGVGLFRSEFLFLDRPGLPGEEEQFAAYRRAAETMKGLPVIIRTLDIGGDKNVPALALPKEQNPFLGYRAIRLCLDREDLFLTQLRALLRAAAFGDVRIMLPMIASLEEIRRAKALLQKAREQLKERGCVCPESVPLGVMVEIPAAAVCADLLAEEADFFSIGTNDLIQYTCAVDRVNDRVASLYRPLHPAVLRLIRRTAAAAQKRGIDCGVCGEMAGAPGMAAVLCGLGVTHLSMPAPSISAAKYELAQRTAAECEALAARLLDGRSAAENEVILREAGYAAAVPRA